MSPGDGVVFGSVRAGASFTAGGGGDGDDTVTSGDGEDTAATSGDGAAPAGDGAAGEALVTDASLMSARLEAPK